MTLEDEAESAIKELKVLTKKVGIESNLRQRLEDIEIALSHHLEHLEKEKQEKKYFPTKEHKEAVEKRELTLRNLLSDFKKLVPGTREEKKIKEDRQVIAKTFGTLLREHREDRKESLSIVIERVKKDLKINTVLPTDPNWYRRVEDGKQLVELTSIPALAIAYDIELSHLQALAASPEFNIIHLRPKEDFEGIPLLKPEVKGTSYRVPRAKLAGSTTVVIEATISKNGASLLHSHPGEEIIIVLKGKIIMKFPEMTGWLKSVPLSEGEILHFDSTILHQLIYAQSTNSDPNSNAEIIVIRILK